MARLQPSAMVLLELWPRRTSCSNLCCVKKAFLLGMLELKNVRNTDLSEPARHLNTLNAKERRDILALRIDRMEVFGQPLKSYR